MPSYTTAGITLHHWPREIKPSQVSINLRYHTGAFVSPFTRTSQTVEYPGAVHDLELSATSLGKSEFNAAKAFLASLRGMAGRFVFGAYPCRYAPPVIGQAERSTIIPLTADIAGITADDTHISADATEIQMETTFTVSSAPDATTLTGTLWFNSALAPLEVGGQISFDDADGWRHLHTITELTHNRSTGAATLKLAPPMRALPTVATPIHVHAPSGIFMLAGDQGAALSPAGSRHSLSVSAVQAFPLKVAA